MTCIVHSSFLNANEHRTKFGEKKNNEKFRVYAVGEGPLLCSYDVCRRTSIKYCMHKKPTSANRSSITS